MTAPVHSHPTAHRRVPPGVSDALRWALLVLAVVGLLLTTAPIRFG